MSKIAAASLLRNGQVIDLDVPISICRLRELCMCALGGVIQVMS